MWDNGRIRCILGFGLVSLLLLKRWFWPFVSRLFVFLKNNLPLLSLFLFLLLLEVIELVQQERVIIVLLIPLDDSLVLLEVCVLLPRTLLEHLEDSLQVHVPVIPYDVLPIILEVHIGGGVSRHVERLLGSKKLLPQVQDSLDVVVDVLLLLRLHDGHELENVLGLWATGGVAVEKEAGHGVHKAGVFEAVDDDWAFMGEPFRGSINSHYPQHQLLVLLDLVVELGTQVVPVGFRHSDLFGLHLLLWSQVGGDQVCSLLLLDLSDLDLGVEDEDAAIDGADPAEGLGDVTDAVVHIKVRGLAVDSTRLHKPPKSLDHLETGVLGLNKRMWLPVLVPANPVEYHLKQPGPVVQHLHQKLVAKLVFLLAEQTVEILVDVTVLVELVGGVVVSFDLVELVVDFDQLVDSSEQVFSFEETQPLGVEDGLEVEGHLLQLPIQDEEHLVDGPKLHVLVHVGFLHQLTSQTRPREDSGLDVDVVPPQSLGVLLPPLDLLHIPLHDIFRQDPLIQQRGIVLAGKLFIGHELMQLLQGEGPHVSAVTLFELENKAFEFFDL